MDDDHDTTSRSSEDQDDSSQQGTGRNKPRSRNGCFTCRTKKVKCDEGHHLEGESRCGRCTRLRLFCDYAPRKKRRRITPTSSSALVKFNGVQSLPSELPNFRSSASSLELNSDDHEAIRYYRTTFSAMHHTKSPDYSLYAIIFKLAESSPMIMRVILALGGQEIEQRRLASADTSTEITLPRSKNFVSPLHHYSEALRLMAGTIDTNKTVTLEGKDPVDFDTISAALYLMLMYEEKYGDPECFGVANHLAGAASILKHSFGDIPLAEAIGFPGNPNAKLALARLCPKSKTECRQASLFTARIIVWLALRDAAASTFGLGGELNFLLNGIKKLSDPNTGFLNGADSLHKYSYSLYRLMWQDEYPEEELLDDIENRHVYSLDLCSSQLRYRVAQLARLDDHTAALKEAEAVQTSLQHWAHHFNELLGIADGLTAKTDNSRRIVRNIRRSVPNFYATLIEFTRIARRIGFPTKTIAGAEYPIPSIMKSALQAYKHKGIEAMVGIAWPLFMVGLETDDEAHREWVLARFRAMTSFGQNIARAYRFLEKVTTNRNGMSHQKIDVDLLDTLSVTGEKFVL